MSNPVITKSYSSPPFSEKEILRYAGTKTPDSQTAALMNSCIKEAEGGLKYKICYCELPLKINGDICDFGSFKTYSRQLSKNLEGCNKVLLFGATIGIEIDRLITKYSRISPAKALMLQAIGAERIEALCDAFCKDYEEENGICLKPRFSPGYGDLPLETQKDIFSMLDCPRKIGLSLNGSLLMSPTKSVTAIVGITNKTNPKIENKCLLCNKTDCTFRS